MANATTNPLFACNSFTSLSQVLANITKAGMNITQAVEQCENICSLAWGTGNPDLSGIGANVSYIIQIIFIGLFGPILFSLWALADRHGETKRTLSKIANAFMDTSAQFSIPVAIAAVVRLKQDAPYFEISFMQSLISMQILGMFATSISALVGNQRTRRVGVIISYLVVEFVFVMAFVALLRMSRESWIMIQELIAGCREYGPIRPGFSYIAPPGHVSKKALDHFLATAGWLDIIYIAAAAVIILGILAMGARILELLIHLVTRHQWILILVSKGFTVGGVYFMVQMEHKRNAMKSVTGVDFVDQQWGFGQVIALFLWVPLVVQVVYFVLATPKRAKKLDLEERYASSAGTYAKVRSSHELEQNENTELTDISSEPSPAIVRSTTI